VTCKIVSEMTYNVSSGTLNSTISLYYLYILLLLLSSLFKLQIDTDITR